MEFLKGNQANAFKVNVSKCFWIDNEEFAEYWLEFGVDIHKTKVVSWELAGQFDVNYS